VCHVLRNKSKRNRLAGENCVMSRAKQSVLGTKYYEDNKIKDDTMSRRGSKHEEMRDEYKILIGKIEGKTIQKA
jgi:hypothetical protein